MKVIVVGDVLGQFGPFFERMAAITKAQNFEYLFCVGNFFRSNSKGSQELEDLISGKIKVPLPTYILGPNVDCHVELYDSIKSVPNLTNLGKKGIFTLVSGLRVVYLSGLEYRKNGTQGRELNPDIHFTKNDVKDVINMLDPKVVNDLLITSEWPRGISNFSEEIDAKVKSVDNESRSSPLISLLSVHVKPRYQFAGLEGFYYARIPYRNVDEQGNLLHVTRFYGLSPFYRNNERKWLYGFNITPAHDMTEAQLMSNTGPATVCPFAFEKIGNEKKSDNENQFFFETASSSSARGSKRSHGNDNHRGQPKKSVDPSNCWFCFSNLDVEKQLIVTIGTYCYVTLAKGVLVPEHVLIVPIHHALSSSELTGDILEEIADFKNALARYFHDKNRDVVIFERNHWSPHLQIQVVPVPKHLKEDIIESLLTEAKKHRLEMHELPNHTHIQEIVPPKKPYFYFELMVDKKTEVKFLHKVDGKFPLQLGRAVLASPKVLDVMNRIEWKDCTNSTLEKEMAENMRKAFKPYDPTEE